MSATLPDLLPKQRGAAVLGESGYDRAPLDAYFTEEACTMALLGVLDGEGMLNGERRVIHEPACGDGAMVTVMQRCGYTVHASDIFEYVPSADLYPVADFFSTGHEHGPFHAIISNPPFKASEKFVAHALELTRPHQGLVAVILRTDWDCASGRRALLAQNPAYALKLVLTWRPKWRVWGAPPLAPGKKEQAPRFNYAWFVFDHRNLRPGDPIIRYRGRPKRR